MEIHKKLQKQYKEPHEHPIICFPPHRVLCYRQSVIRTRHWCGSRATSHRWARASHVLDSARFTMQMCDTGISLGTHSCDPATAVMQTVSLKYPSSPLHSHPNSSSTSSFWFILKHLMVVHINRLLHVSLNVTPQDLNIHSCYFPAAFCLTCEIRSDA